MGTEPSSVVGEARPESLVLGAYRDGDRFHVADVETGEVFASAGGDPLEVIVRAAEALGLPWMRLILNRDGEPVSAGQPVVVMEAAEGGGRRGRLNPLELRAKLAERQRERAERGVRLALGPREFGPDRPSLAQPPRKFTAEQEAMYRRVYGAYWRSPEMEADCLRLYGDKDPGYWGRKLDERIAATWREVLALGDRLE